MKKSISAFALLVLTPLMAQTASSASPLHSNVTVQLAQNKGGGESNSSDGGPTVDSKKNALSSTDRKYAREYSTVRKHPVVKYNDELIIGQEFPDVNTVYAFEGRESLNGYRYAIINERTVLIDPNTRRIVEIID